jgi:molybdate transport system substrate-binding protein
MSTCRALLRIAFGVALVGLSACVRAEVPFAPLTVLAASSLTESLQSVGAAWHAGGNGVVTFSFDATSKMAKQVDAGAPADAFFSADPEWMDYLDRRGRLAPGSRVTLLGNELVAVVGVEAAFVPGSASDLAHPSVEHLALAGENVPAGRYGRAALANLGVWESVAGRVVSGDNVRTTLGWVAGGEAEVGVVYATDARVEPGVKIAFTFPASSHPTIAYEAAALAGSTRADDAQRFLSFCRSAEARALFAAAGFLPAPS